MKEIILKKDKLKELELLKKKVLSSVDQSGSTTNTNEIFEKYINHEITNIEAASIIGVSRGTFFRLVKEHRNTIIPEQIVFSTQIVFEQMSEIRHFLLTRYYQKLLYDGGKEFFPLLPQKKDLDNIVSKSLFHIV